MADENSQKIYLLGSKSDSDESIIVIDNQRMAVLAFETFDDAKESFKQVYDLLLVPSFTPSNPPSDDELKYHGEFMRLMYFRPIIVGLNKDTALQVMKEWKEGQTLYVTDDKFYDFDYWHCPMRSGFLEKFGVLDIVKDIEETPFVGPDGKMVLRFNSTNHSSSGNGQLKGLSENEIDDLLRKRGYL